MGLADHITHQIRQSSTHASSIQAPNVTLALRDSNTYTGAKDERGSETHNREYEGHGKRER